jgi:hypothetical protein
MQVPFLHSAPRKAADRLMTARGVPLALFLWISAWTINGAAAASLDASVQKRLREGTFEVVLGKPDDDPLSYEKPLPLDLLPFGERTDKHRSIGTAFAIGHGRFVTAGHVVAAGCGSQNGPLAIRDANENIYLVDQIIKFSQEEDYAVFTVLGEPHVTALETRARPAVGETVFAVGNAYGEGIVIRDGLYTSDTLEERDGRWKWLRFSAAASPGNSGGPLVDARGRVIGVVLRKSPNENLNVAVAIDQVLKGSEESANFAGRSVYKFPLMMASDAFVTDEKFPLPKAIADFYASALATAQHVATQARARYVEQHGERMFPHGADSQPLLNTLAVTPFPRAIEEHNDGKWGLAEPKVARADLEQNGFVENTPFPTGRLLRIRMPDDVSWGDLYADSKLYMDLALKGVPLQRVVGPDRVRVTSLGRAGIDTTYEDAYGRTWQLRAWPVPYNDSVVISIALPTPQGYVTLLEQRPSVQREEAFDEMRWMTGFLYIQFTGTLKQWQAYLAAPLTPPAIFKTLTIHADYGKSFQFRSKRFALSLPNSLQTVAADSILLLKFAYLPTGNGPTGNVPTGNGLVGNEAVWDVGGLYLADTEHKGHWIDILRHHRPPPGLPEAFSERWHAIETASHPYTATAFPAEGMTRIETVQNAGDIASGKASIAYSVTLVAEGSQDQGAMKRALQALQGDLTVFEQGD